MPGRQSNRSKACIRPCLCMQTVECPLTWDALHSRCFTLEQEQLCVNVSQCITNVAEAPEARPILKE
jgi:hypothetical protein